MGRASALRPAGDSVTPPLTYTPGAPMHKPGFSNWYNAVDDQMQATIGENAAEYASLLELQQWYEDGETADAAARRLVARSERVEHPGEREAVTQRLSADLNEVLDSARRVLARYGINAPKLILAARNPSDPNYVLVVGNDSVEQFAAQLSTSNVQPAS